MSVAASPTVSSQQNSYFAREKPLTEVQVPEWQRIASRERHRRDSAIRQWERDQGIRFSDLDNTSSMTNTSKAKRIMSDSFPDQQLAITESLPSDLLQNMAHGHWSAEQVFLAFAARACLAHHLTNSLTEVFFARGLTRARELDQYLEKNGKVIGPLHGLPISVKDVFNIKGMDSTSGFVSLVGRPAASTDTLIEKLHDAGAVLYCKTNIPQTLMSGECTNFIFGRTVSAHNTSLSAGGSSGGEGSLVAMGGSPLGIGTDIAGSIRTPANFNGIYGLCPSFGRFPSYGPGHASGLGPVNAVAGPLSRSIDGLETYTKTLLNLRPWEWDSSCVRLPWDQDAYEEAAPSSLRGPTTPDTRLCFGMIPDDSVITPHPPIQRCMREVKQALITAGHSVVDLADFFDASDCLWELLTTIFKADGGKGLRAQLAVYDEPLVPGETLEIRPDDFLSAEELGQLAKQVRTLQQKYLDRWTATKRQSANGQPVDMLILPSGAYTACPHGTMDYWLYEAISNILDWTCATIPVGVVDPVKDAAPPSVVRHPLSPADAANREKCKFFPLLCLSPLCENCTCMTPPFQYCDDYWSIILTRLLAKKSLWRRTGMPPCVCRSWASASPRRRCWEGCGRSIARLVGAWISKHRTRLGVLPNQGNAFFLKRTNLSQICRVS